MAYFSTEPASERRNPTGKNRVWDFFRLSNETHRANRRQPAQRRRKIRPTATKPVSGIPYWPSRDPIGERAFFAEYVKDMDASKKEMYLKESFRNSYLFVGNDPVSHYDKFGLVGPTSPVVPIIIGAKILAAVTKHTTLCYNARLACFNEILEGDGTYHNHLTYWSNNPFQFGWIPFISTCKIDCGEIKWQCLSDDGGTIWAP